MSDWNAETAEWYAEKYGEYPTNRLAVDRLRLRPDAAVLDVGCGTGAALRHAAIRVVDGTLVGVDPVPRMVEIAEARTEGQPRPIRYRVGSAGQLPVEDAAFDVVLAFDSFDHWTDPQRGLGEVLRVLRADGLFVVVKDGGVAAARSFRPEAEAAGFRVESEDHIKDEGVRFTLWRCRR